MDAKPVNPRARKWKPYFPGYLFVRANLTDLGVSAIQYMPYSVGLVEFGGEPAVIPDEIIQSLQKSITTKNNTDERPYWLPGTALTVNSGPFAGYEAIFDTNLPSSDRIRILLQVIRGKQVAVELPVDYVQRKTAC
jgi:transcriptional antiterminator RfaH